MAGNSGKDPAGIAGRSTRRSTSISWLAPWSFRFPIWRQRGFFGGEGGKCLVGVTGSLCFERESHLKEFHFISTKNVCFYAKGSFPRRRHISTAEVYFYGGGNLVPRVLSYPPLSLRRVGTREPWERGCGEGTFLRRRCISTQRCISTKKVYFYARSQFKSNRLMTCMEKRN